MNEIIEQLATRCGRYEGRGINYEKKYFKGELDMDCIIENSGIIISFRATGEDHSLLHEERSLIAVNQKHDLYLFTLSTNTFQLLPLEFRKYEHIDFARDSITFGYGMANDVTSFREEISILLWYTGDLGYIYRWGVPGGEFKIRLKVRMKKLNPATW